MQGFAEFEVCTVVHNDTAKNFKKSPQFMTHGLISRAFYIMAV